MDALLSIFSFINWDIVLFSTLVADVFVINIILLFYYFVQLIP